MCGEHFCSMRANRKFRKILQSQEGVFVARCSENRVDTDGEQQADNETTATHRCNCHHSENPLKA